MQSVLEYFGNELINISGHVAVRHMIIGAEDRTEVNSFHNQGCVSIKSPDIEVIMQAEDGVIEKIRHTTFPIYGTMWHPEREKPFNDNDIVFVRTLFMKRGK